MYQKDKQTNSSKNVVVGIIGYPNVGKSSVINSLVKFRKASVSNKPGFTKSVQ